MSRYLLRTFTQQMAVENAHLIHKNVSSHNRSGQWVCVAVATMHIMSIMCIMCASEYLKLHQLTSSSLKSETLLSRAPQNESAAINEHICRGSSTKTVLFGLLRFCRWK